MTLGVCLRSKQRGAGAMAAFLLAALFLAGGCASRPQSGLPVVSMQIGTRTFDLEVARSKTELDTGLMNRDSMPANHGMIFVFESDQLLHFWMENTRIPLDIIFISSDGRVVSVRQMAAYDTTTDSNSEGLAEYAIELNLGAAAAAGVLPGDHLDIPTGARAPAHLQTAP
jgi:uncharacterized protein